MNFEMNVEAEAVCEEQPQEQPPSSCLMALSYREKKMGCAIARERDLLVMEELPESKPFHLVDLLIMQFMPTALLLPTRMDEELLAKFSPESRQMRPMHEFTVSSAMIKMRHNGMMVSEELARRYPLSFGCIGGLLSHLMRLNDGILLIENVEWFSMANYMRITGECLEALQIKTSESLHPNINFNHSPQSLSLMRLYEHHCKTVGGRELLRAWMQRPLGVESELEDRWNEVDWLVRVETEMVGDLQKVLAGAASFRYSRNRNKISILNGVLAGIRAVTLCKQLLGNTLLDKEIELEELHELQNLIVQVVNLKASKAENRVIFQRGVNQKLDELYEVFDRLEDILSEVAKEIAPTVKHTSQLNVVYYPQIGYLIAIPTMNQLEGEALASTNGFEMFFSTDRACYFKNERMRDLDEEMGDLSSEIADIEIELGEELFKNIRECDGGFKAVEAWLAYLDCVCAVSCVAKEHQLTRPIVGESIILAQARHLLQEMFVPSFIPNDFSPEGKKITILTGPNSSGKSVFMKQLGLVQYMGQSGGFVPAEMAQIILVDKLLTRMRTKDSSGNGESTFSFELRQMKEALEAATGNSLLLIDEFGKGTAPEDGIALLAGFVKFLMEMAEDERPWVVIITHFREVYQLLEEYEEAINWLWMQVTLSEDQVTYQYRAMPGKSTSSLALQCAKRAGIPTSILNRAKELERVIGSGTLVYELSRQQNAGNVE